MCSVPFGNRSETTSFRPRLATGCRPRLHSLQWNQPMQMCASLQAIGHRAAGALQPEIIGEMARRSEFPHVHVGMRWKHVRIAAIAIRTFICMIRKRFFQLVWDVAFPGVHYEYVCEHSSFPRGVRGYVVFVGSLDPLQSLQVCNHHN